MDLNLVYNSSNIVYIALSYSEWIAGRGYELLLMLFSLPA